MYIRIFVEINILAFVLQGCTPSISNQRSSRVQINNKVTPSSTAAPHSPQVAITAVYPPQIFNGGGTRVRLIGSNFTSGIGVLVNGKKVDATLTSPNEIIFTSPTAAEGDVAISLQLDGKELATKNIQSARDAFSVLKNFNGGDNYFATKDGTGTDARLFQPTGVAFANDSLYISQIDNAIREVNLATLKVTTIAGASGPGGLINGAALQARFNNPTGLAVIGTKLYIADTGNNAIRVLDLSTKVVSTLVGGTGSADGAFSVATVSAPNGLAALGTDLFLSSGDHTIRKLDLVAMTITTLAGLAGTSGTTDDLGSAARFNTPHGIVALGSNLYVADFVNYSIRKVVIATGAVTTFAGQSGAPGSTNAVGSSARFNLPIGVASDGTYLFVSDYGNHQIRRVALSDQTVTLMAGSTVGSVDGTSGAAKSYYPTYISYGGGYAFFGSHGTSNIRRVDAATSEVLTIAGAIDTIASRIGAQATSSFRDIRGMVHDDNYIYISEHSAHCIKRVNRQTGETSVFAGSIDQPGYVDGSQASARLQFPWGLAIDDSYLYVAEYYSAQIRKISLLDGTVSTLTSTTTYPAGLAIHDRNLYVCQGHKDTIHRVNLDTEVYSLYAGSEDTNAYADGAVATARFNSPHACMILGAKLYLGDSGNRLVRVIDLVTNTVSTIAGVKDGALESKDGIGTQAKFNNISSLSTDGLNLYIADLQAFVIRKIKLSDPLYAVSTIAGSHFATGASEDPLSPSLTRVPAIDYIFGYGLFIGASETTKILK